MDDQRVGRIVRALRRRRGWRQLDLAAAAGCSQSLVSLVERGHLDSISLRTLRATLGALDARVAIDVYWRAGDLDRLLDDAHARVVALVLEFLRRHGWIPHTETTYSRYGERGSYDVLGFHPRTATVLVVEVKTDLPSAEGMLRKLDEKSRLAPLVVRERFGWRTEKVARLLVLPDERTLRRRVDRHSALLTHALPQRSNEVRRWLASPSDSLAGLWFLTVTNPGSGSRGPGGRVRVRIPGVQSSSSAAAA